MLLYAIERFLGHENVSNVALQDLQHNRFKLAHLHGKLANISADLSSKLMDGSEVFKKITSGDTVNAEKKGKDSFDFIPFAKLMFSANELPPSNELGHSFFRRWVLIEFTRTFTKEERDPKLTCDTLNPLIYKALCYVYHKYHKFFNFYRKQEIYICGCYNLWLLRTMLGTNSAILY
ncbi:DUF5906 domain-containing protein [Alteribacillus bidgolensis]|uniref:DUF5906 domain-containing protein n=1 Tax=Alteribacillus bidgolensis TaxID=930129 RepID=UPI000B8296BF|nr:DUF5906 domain-containing protein [Alteribacillus bidgolensis]